MRLTNIRAENFKGRSFDYDLPPKLAIVGRNFAGKSAVIDAIRWLLMGYVPEVGKLNSALWEYSSGDFMQVEGKTDSGDTLSRRLESVRGSIKASGSSSFVPTGSSELALIPGLDANYYFGLSDKERVNYVYSAVETPKEFSTESLIVELDNIRIDGLSDEELEFTKKQLMPYCASLANGIPIDSVLQTMREQFTYWNRREKDTIGAVRTLTELKLRSQEASTLTVKDISEEVAKLREISQNLTTQLVQEHSRRERAKEVEKERSRLQFILDSKFDGDTETARFERLIKEAKDKKKSVLSLAARTQKASEIQAISEKRDTAVADFGTATSNLEQFDKKLKELGALKECPYCRSHDSGWKDRLKQHLADSIEFNTGLRDGASSIIVAADIRLSDLRVELDNDYRDIQDNANLDKSITGWRHQIELIKVKARNFKEEQDQATTLIRALPKFELMREEEHTALTQKRDTIKTDISKLEELQHVLIKLQQDLKRAAESEQEHNHAKAMVKVIKKAAEILNERKKAMVEIVFSELLKTANSICGPILKTPLSLFDSTIGRWKGSKFIPHRVFSGTEKALCYTAISVALSAKAPMKLAIIDEFQRLDKYNQTKALGMLSAAVDKGTLEQFIIVGTEVTPMAGPTGPGTPITTGVTLLTVE